MAETTVGCPVQVGRDDCIAALERSAEAARRSGRLLLIAGEAGVGKTRLAGEALRIAEEAGMVRLRGESSPDAGVGYAPFVTALRRHTRSMSDAAVRELFSGRATLAAVLLPEVAGALDMMGRNPDPDDLCAAFWHVLARLAGTEGVLLLLEDIHWADNDSLRLLAYLAREVGDLAVWMVATYRSDELHRRHPLLPVLAALERERRLEEIRLQPLGRDDVRRMVSALLDGTTVGGEFLDAVLERTAGNPFFVEELIKTLVDCGDVFLEGREWNRRALEDIHLPLSVREALLTRYRTLEPAIAEVLAVAACAGDRLDPDVLSLGLGDPAAVSAAVAEGLERQLLVEDRIDGRPVYRFRHALTREAIADDVPGPARHRSHHIVAQGLLAAHADDPDAVAAELAEHLEQAGHADQASDHALRAARRAADAGAVDQAVQWFETALRLRNPSPGERLDLLLEAAESTFTVRDMRPALAFAEEARRLAGQLGDPAREAQALWTIEEGRYRSGDTPGALAELEEARGLVAGRDPFREAWTLAKLTRLYVLMDRPDDAVALLARGEEVAEASGHQAALSQLYGTRLLLAESEEEAEAAYQAGRRAARASGDPLRELNLSGNRGYSATWTGRLAQGRDALAEAVQLGRRLRPGIVSYHEAGLAWVSSLTGDYGAVRELAAAVGSDPDVPTRLVLLAALTEVAERVEGDTAAWALMHEQEAAAQQSGEAQRLVLMAAAKARMVSRRDGIQVALPLFREVLALTTNQRGRGSHWMFSPEAAWALAGSGATAELEAWTASIAALTERDPHQHNRAASQLCEAARAGAAGEVEKAEALLLEAAAVFREMPYPAREVETLLELARLRLEAERIDEAAGPAREAHDLARRIQARQLIDAAADILDRAEGGSVLATVLFTDVVASTEQLVRLGDVDWTELLARHHGIVRRELARYGGREIDTAGDGFLISFDSPARAVRCATALIDSLRAVGLTIRAGLHTGECRISGGKLTGLAVHIAARVASEAAPGEALVSGTVRDLVAGSGIPFEDRGQHELKGVPGEWRLFAAGR